MVSALSREAMMAQRRCGMQPMAGMSTPIMAMLVVSTRWPGHQMASASPQGVPISRRRCGMQPMAGMSTPIMAMLITSMRWYGHLMASAWFLEAGISIMEVVIQPRRYGMQQMAGISISIAGIPAPYGQSHGRRMAPTSPQGVRARQCRYGERGDENSLKRR